MVPIDKDVVFRTSYYFRVFDYCVAKNQQENRPEKNIIPLTDSLYRFKMTGKANSLLSDVKFESGTLSEAEIEPFSQRVEYDTDSRRHRIVSKQEVEEDARRARAKADLRELTATRDRLIQQMGDDAQATVNSANQAMLTNVNTAIAQMLQFLYQLQQQDAGTGDGGGATEMASTLSNAAGQRSRLEQGSILTNSGSYDGVIDAVADAILARYTSPDAGAVYNELRYGPTFDILYNGVRPQRKSSTGRTVTEVSADLIDRIEQELIAKGALTPANRVSQPAADGAPAPAPLTVVSPIGTGPSIRCPDDAPTQRGFQVLGPEGWRTFDQDQRLLMAMSSSAQPLISTLKELSSRVLESRASPEAELLPLALERARVADTERRLDQDRDAEGQTPEALSQAVCQALLTADQSAEICQ